jgi:hypothetical protein
MKIKEINEMFSRGIVPECFLFDKPNPLLSEPQTMQEEKPKYNITEEDERTANSNTTLEQ